MGVPCLLALVFVLVEGGLWEWNLRFNRRVYPLRPIAAKVLHGVGGRKDVFEDREIPWLRRRPMNLMVRRLLVIRSCLCIADCWRFGIGEGERMDSISALFISEILCLV